MIFDIKSQNTSQNSIKYLVLKRKQVKQHTKSTQRISQSKHEN